MTVLANGCVTTNCGTVVDWDGIQVELLGQSKGYSTHPYNIVVSYAMLENGKVSVSYYKHPEVEESHGYEVYFYNDEDSLHHYYSKRYDDFNLPKRYEPIARTLRDAHKYFFK